MLRCRSAFMVVRGAGVFVCCGCGLVFLAGMFRVVTSWHNQRTYILKLCWHQVVCGAKMPTFACQANMLPTCCRHLQLRGCAVLMAWLTSVHDPALPDLILIRITIEPGMCVPGRTRMRTTDCMEVWVWWCSGNRILRLSCIDPFHCRLFE